MVGKNVGEVQLMSLTFSGRFLRRGELRLGCGRQRGERWW